MSVIVPFRGDAAAAEAAIDALERLRVTTGDELIVVENASRRVVPRRPGGPTVVPAGERPSSYYARNGGARSARGEWLLFIDADCQPPAALLDTYFQEPVPERVGVVAGEVVGDATQDSRLARWARSRRGRLASHHLEGWPHPAGITGNLLIRREAFDQLDGFDDTVRSAADVELCWRAQRRGWAFAYRPASVVVHRDPERLATVLRQAWRYGSGRRWLRRRYGRSVPRPGLVRPLVRSVGGLVVWGLSGRFERATLKLIDGLTATVTWLGYAFGDNGA